MDEAQELHERRREIAETRAGIGTALQRLIRGRGRPNGLFADTLWMMVGFGARILTQAAFFIIVARSLGASGYGIFMGAAALSAVVAPFSGLGTGNLLIKNVARDANTFRRQWGNVILVTISTGILLVGVLAGAGALFLHGRVPLHLIVTVGVADLIFGRLLDASSQAFQALGRMKRTAQLQALPTIAKLFAAIGLIVLASNPSASDWGRFYLGASIAAAGLAAWLVSREAGRPTFVWTQAFDEVREGWHFSVGFAAQNIYNDVDKTMLASLSTASSVGIYAAAYRLIDVSFAPVRSLLYASYTTFFRVGARGINGTVAHARRLLPYAWAYGAAVSLGLFAIAPIVPHILGRDYQNAVAAIRWLSLLPLLKATHYLAADSLTGAGFQPSRSGIQLFIAGVNIAINFVLIPRYSWVGAAWASLVCDGLLAAALWGTAWWYLARERVRRDGVVVPESIADA